MGKVRSPPWSSGFQRRRANPSRAASIIGSRDRQPLRPIAAASFHGLMPATLILSSPERLARLAHRPLMGARSVKKPTLCMSPMCLAPAYRNTADASRFGASSPALAVVKAASLRSLSRCAQIVPGTTSCIASWSQRKRAGSREQEPTSAAGPSGSILEAPPAATRALDGMKEYSYGEAAHRPCTCHAQSC